MASSEVYEVSGEGALQDAVVDRLVEMAESYSKESGLNFTFDGDNTYRSIYSFLTSDVCSFLVLRLDDELVGFVSLIFDSMWMKEVTCTMHMFYIIPEHRSHVMANDLLKGALAAARSRGAVQISSNTISQINDRITRSYELLLSHSGFKALSPLYVKEL